MGNDVGLSRATGAPVGSSSAVGRSRTPGFPVGTSVVLVGTSRDAGSLVGVRVFALVGVSNDCLTGDRVGWGATGSQRHAIEMLYPQVCPKTACSGPNPHVVGVTALSLLGSNLLSCT